VAHVHARIRVIHRPHEDRKSEQRAKCSLSKAGLFDDLVQQSAAKIAGMNRDGRHPFGDWMVEDEMAAALMLAFKPPRSSAWMTCRALSVGSRVMPA